MIQIRTWYFNRLTPLHTQWHIIKCKNLTNSSISSAHFPASASSSSPTHELPLDWLRWTICEMSVVAGLSIKKGIQSHWNRRKNSRYIKNRQVNYWIAYTSYHPSSLMHLSHYFCCLPSILLPLFSVISVTHYFIALPLYFSPSVLTRLTKMKESWMISVYATE